MREINRIFVHCSDTPDERDHIDAAEIRRWHTAPKLQPGEPRDPTKLYGNGWSDIGYHYVVRRNGQIEHGRAEATKGAHVDGANFDSLGVCWVGRSALIGVQHEAMIVLLLALMQRHKLGVSSVFGHYEANAGKTCPNIDMDALRAVLRGRTSHV